MEHSVAGTAGNSFPHMRGESCVLPPLFGRKPLRLRQSGYTQTIGIFTAFAHTCGQPAAYAPKPVHSFRFPHGRGKRRLASLPLRELSKNSFYISHN